MGSRRARARAATVRSRARGCANRRSIGSTEPTLLTSLELLSCTDSRDGTSELETVPTVPVRVRFTAWTCTRRPTWDGSWRRIADSHGITKPAVSIAATSTEVDTNVRCRAPPAVVATLQYSSVSRGRAERVAQGGVVSSPIAEPLWPYLGASAYVDQLMADADQSPWPTLTAEMNGPWIGAVCPSVVFAAWLRENSERRLHLDPLE